MKTYKPIRSPEAGFLKRLIPFLPSPAVPPARCLNQMKIKSEKSVHFIIFDFFLSVQLEIKNWIIADLVTNWTFESLLSREFVLVMTIIIALLRISLS